MVRLASDKNVEASDVTVNEITAVEYGECTFDLLDDTAGELLVAKLVVCIQPIDVVHYYHMYPSPQPSMGVQTRR